MHSWIRKAALLFGAAVVALGLALLGMACDGDDEGEGEATATPAATEAASPAATGSPLATAPPAATASPATESSSTVWLCRPGLPDNPCESSLETTVVSADGTSTVESAAPAESPPIDCFYVYPTVSGQTTPNANLEIDPEQTAIAIQQASRFSQVCRVYAPVYRQVTLSGFMTSPEEAGALAYGDALSAWHDYLANYNDGRGVVLIGHSQGALGLTRLITSEIDPDPSLRGLLVSALLIGSNVIVAAGEDAGGDFQNIPACRSADQTGCVVAYSSFDREPPPGAYFGRVGTGNTANELTGENVQILCVNPAALSGGTGPLLPYFGGKFPGPFGSMLPTPPSVPTPWLAYPGLYTAHCESVGGATWLQIDTTDVAGDQRPVVAETPSLVGWGLHLFDVNLALGNLVDLVRQQEAAYSR